MSMSSYSSMYSSRVFFQNISFQACFFLFEHVFFSSKGDLNFGAFLRPPFEVDFEPLLGSEKAPKRAR